MNHGGLYGRANEANFPNVNDYRNIVVAETMKVLGFVNRHSRGVLKVQKDLMANENGMPIYNFTYQTAVSVRENKSENENDSRSDKEWLHDKRWKRRFAFKHITKKVRYDPFSISFRSL